MARGGFVGVRVSECGSVWMQVPEVCRLFVTVLTVSDRRPHGGLQQLTVQLKCVGHVGDS